MLKNFRHCVLGLILILFIIMPVTTAVGTQQNGRIGTYLVNDEKLTLYHFIADLPGKSVCYTDCTTTWRPFFTANIAVSGNLNAYDFKTIKREDGNFQTTYKDQPLYTYTGDTKPGDVNGEEIDGTWFVVRV
jgi:predicted lipoprotein with Yx(FWY)xxD motif